MAIVVTDDKHYKAIADAIREESPWGRDLKTKELKPSEMADAVDMLCAMVQDEGYVSGLDDGYQMGFQLGYDDGFTVGEQGGIAEGIEQGKQTEYDRMWDMIQQNGNRAAYEYAFADWGWDHIRTKYKIVPTYGGVPYAFAYNINLKKVEAACVDLSKTTMSDTSAVAAYGSTFVGCAALEEVEDIGMPAGYYYQTFHGCKKLHTIARMRFKSTTMISEAFVNCSAMVNLIVEGAIGQNGLNLQWSTKLSKASITSVINALSAATSGKSITLSQRAVNAAFTTEEWATLVAIKSNWTINLV